jgi:hypothetical protein
MGYENSWWMADDRNMVVLCADSDIIHRIVACALCYGGRYPSAWQSLGAYYLATHNRIMAEVLKRRVLPSEKRFLTDFTSVITASKIFTVPSLVCFDMHNTRVDVHLINLVIIML